MRTQLEQELEELTASLFEVQGRARAAGWLSWASTGASPLTWSLPSSQEAHKMVREANMKQAASEKQLKETRGKVRHPPAGPDLLPASEPCERRPSLPPDRTLAWPGGPAGRGRDIRDGPPETCPLQWEPSSLGLELCFC